MSSPQSPQREALRVTAVSHPTIPRVPPWPTGPTTGQPRTLRSLRRLALQLLLPVPRVGQAPRGTASRTILPHPDMPMPPRSSQHSSRVTPHLTPPALSFHQALSGPNLLHLVSRAPGSPTHPKHNLCHRVASACCRHHRRPHAAPCRAVILECHAGCLGHSTRWAVCWAPARSSPLCGCRSSNPASPRKACSLSGPPCPHLSHKGPQGCSPCPPARQGSKHSHMKPPPQVKPLWLLTRWTGPPPEDAV